MSAFSVCFFWISALTRLTAALPSAESWKTACGLKIRDLRARRERRGRLRGRRGLRARRRRGVAGAGCAGAGCAGRLRGRLRGCANTGAALIAINDSASDAAIAEPLIALIPFVSRKPLILYQMRDSPREDAIED